MEAADVSTIPPVAPLPPPAPDKREIFFGMALIMSMIGLGGAGFLAWWKYPQDIEGFMLVVYTLSNVVSFVLGSKSGLSTAPGMAKPPD